MPIIENCAINTLFGALAFLFCLLWLRERGRRIAEKKKGKGEE